jgi:hypothetical protein
MSGTTQYFSIHDIIDFAVIDQTGYFNQRFNTFDTHYENFKCEGKLDDCDLIIELGRFKPELKNTYVVGDKKYYFGEDFLYVPEENYKGGKWKLQAQGFNEERTFAKIDCNALGRLTIPGHVIDFLIHLKLLEKGYPIIHASAVSKNGVSFAFASRGGGGKTTVALELAQNGFNLLGDNFVLIHKGKIYAFPTSLSIFTYNLAPVVADNLDWKEKMSLTSKKMIYKGTMGYAKLFTKINPKKIFPEIEASSKLHTAFLLIPHTKYASKKILVEEMDFHEFVGKIGYNQMLEFPYFCKYIEDYSYLFPNSNLSLHWKKYRESLTDNFPENLKYYKIIVPKHFNDNVFKSIVELVQGVHKEL